MNKQVKMMNVVVCLLFIASLIFLGVFIIERDNSYLHYALGTSVLGNLFNIFKRSDIDL